MKILLTADWHGDRRTEGVSRFPEIRRAALQTVEAALDQHVDVYAFLGDLTNPTDGPAALMAAGLIVEVALALAHESVTVIAIPGNHDPFEDGSGGTALSVLRGLSRHDVHVYERPGVHWLIGDSRVTPIACLPYPPVTSGIKRDGLAAELRTILDRSDPRATGDRARDYRGIVLAHATEVDGAIEGEEGRELRRGRGVRLPLEEVPAGWVVANGHFHTPQTTPGGVLVPGALARLTFGEGKNEPRFLTVDV